MGSSCCRQADDALEVNTGYTTVLLPPNQQEEVEKIQPPGYQDLIQVVYNEYTLEVDISAANDFVQEELYRYIEIGECVIHQNVEITPYQGMIKLNGPRKEVEETNQEILTMFEYLQQSYIKECLDLNEREVTYFNQNLWREKSEIEKNDNCKITIYQIDDLQQEQSETDVVLQLSYQNKYFKIIQGDIQQLESVAVVNTSNQQLEFVNSYMQTGVQQQIQELGGISYQNACKDYIKKNQELKYGTVFIHELNTDLIQYILTIATPFYESGSKTASDLGIIRQNIKSIFQMAHQLQISEITFPILGGGNSGQYFNSVSKAVISSVLEGLYSMNTSVMTANLIEIDEDKIQKIFQIANDIIEQSPNRQVQYQWQWWDEVFKDYDDEEINEQIDVAFEEFTQDNSKNEIRLIFPFSKFPGTHKVDLSKNTLTDKNLNTVQTIRQAIYEGRKFYMFGDLLIDDNLNEYMFIQCQKGILQFEIFYKRHKIIFSNDSIQQVNEDTNHSRQVQAVSYQKPQQLVDEFILNGKQFQLLKFLQNENLYFQQITKSCVIVEVIDIENFNRINQDIQKMIRFDFVKMSFSIPNIEEADLDALIQMIETDSLEIYGLLAIGQKITILVNRDMRQQINNHISQSESRKQVKDLLKLQTQFKGPSYPQEWVAQQQNFVKVDLPANHAEYNKIKELFSASDKGKIHKIYRIQNKVLGTIMLQRNNISSIIIRLEMYVWHGVSAQHPSIIYTSEREGFDSSYSRTGCYWGEGIYFAERAIYSRGYSYKLKANDDVNYVGKKVFMCCLLTTGKVHTCNQDGNLKRPPEGFDCVSGVTGLGNTLSTIYVLYKMQVRRAYPAHEVIYQSI